MNRSTENRQQSMQIQSYTQPYRGDEQGMSRHGRGEEHGREGSSPGTWGGRRGGVPVEDEQDDGGKLTTSRTSGARVGDEQGTGGRRTGGQEEEDWRAEEE